MSLTAQDLITRIEQSARSYEYNGQPLTPVQAADLFVPGWKAEDFSATMETSGSNGQLSRYFLWSTVEMLDWIEKFPFFYTGVHGSMLAYRRIGGCARHFLLSVVMDVDASCWLMTKTVKDQIAGVWHAMLLAAARLNPAILHGNPGLLQWMLNQRSFNPGLRLFVSTDKRVTTDMVRAIDQAYPAISVLDLYGSAELGAITYATKADKLAKVDTSGKVVPWATLTVAPDGKLVHGTAWRTETSPDEGTIDAEGYLYITKSAKGNAVQERSRVPI